MNHALLNALFVLNGFILAVIALVSIAAGFGIWQVIQGRKLLSEINEVHNQLVESVSKVDGKAQEALLRLDHLDQLRKH